MPYIKQTDRYDFDLPIASLGQISTPGELNYVITKICLGYLAYKGKNYQTLNDISGALTNANLEFYRRLSSPYEDSKIKENGDVFNTM